MSLSNKYFKTNYISYNDDIIKDFYINALEEATNYDRVSAFFDSKILARYSIGLENIYKNNGVIRFIFSQELNEDDYNQMIEGYNNRSEDVLLDNFNRPELSEEDKMRLSNLSFLIQQGVIDIKIAFTKSGILHDKFGLIYEGNNYVFFRGSSNETVAGVESNYESFEVSCSWNEESLENEKIENAKVIFDNMWNNRTYGMKVVNLPNVIKSEIIKYGDGQIRFETDINYFDSVVADLDENANFIVRNNLELNYNFETDYDYKMFIKQHVKEYKNRVFIFEDNMNNYLSIQKIVNRFSKSSEYNGYKFVVSSKLRDYIRNKNFEIDIRRELGLSIKKRDSSVYNSFIEFKNIVDNETNNERPLKKEQMWDAFFITKMWKSANYSVPGAGKTTIVYGAFAYLNSKQVNEVDKLIVIGPKNSFKSWKDEFVECFADKKQLSLFNIQDGSFRNASDRNMSLMLDTANKNVILINYDLLDSIKDILKQLINDRTMLVFDEVHKVKAVSGVWASAAMYISPNAKYKVILTGTPIPNSYVDLYSQLNILFSDEYKSFFKFTPSEMARKDDNTAKRINDAIQPFFCRTTKKDLLVPPPNDDDLLISKMTIDEQKLFSLIRKKYNRNGLAMYVRLLQASNNPKLLLNDLNDYDIDNLFDSEEDENLSEADFVKEKLNKEGFTNTSDRSFINGFDMTSKFWNGISKVDELVKEGKQVLVWGIFVNTIERIEEELTKRGIKCKIIYGATPLEDRETIIEQFKDKTINVLITNPHTLAESVSLHKTCHDSVYFEYSFNLTHMLQSRDRINRLGLKENDYTQYYYLMLQSIIPEDDSIDFRTYERLKEKEQIMLNAIEGEMLQQINFEVMDDVKRILNMN